VERLGQPFFGVGTRIGLRSAGAGFTPDEVDRLAWMSSQPGTARAFSRTVADVIDLRGQRRHFLDRAHEIETLPPIALMWGDRDRVLPFTHGRETAALLEGAPFSRYEGCGHFPHRERAERFVHELDTFLEASSVASPRLRTALSVAVPGALERPPSAIRRAGSALVRGLCRIFGIAPPSPQPAPRVVQELPPAASA